MLQSWYINFLQCELKTQFRIKLHTKHDNGLYIYKKKKKKKHGTTSSSHTLPKEEFKMYSFEHLQFQVQPILLPADMQSRRSSKNSFGQPPANNENHTGVVFYIQLN